MWPWSEIEELKKEVNRYKGYYESERKEYNRLVTEMGGVLAVRELEFLRQTIKNFAKVEYVNNYWQFDFKIARTLTEAEQELKELRLYTRVLEGKLTSDQIANAHQECQTLKDLIKA